MLCSIHLQNGHTGGCNQSLSNLAQFLINQPFASSFPAPALPPPIALQDGEAEQHTHIQDMEESP